MATKKSYSFIGIYQKYLNAIDMNVFMEYTLSSFFLWVGLIVRFPVQVPL